MAADTFVKEQLYVEVVARVLPHLIVMGGNINENVDRAHGIALHAIQNYNKAFPDGKKIPKDDA
jgi:hypothetical protein